MVMRFGRSVVTWTIVLAAAFVSPARGAGPAAPAAPTAAQADAAKAEYDAAVRKAERDVAAARQAYLAKLDAALKAAMQAGDLPEANRIDGLRKAAAAVPSAAGDAKPGPAAADTRPADARRKPGWIVGAITDAGGKPVTGVQFDVVAFGTTIQGGQRAEFKLEVDEQGRFEQQLPDGLYAVRAYVVKEFEGNRYRLQLHPNDGKHEQTKLPSKPGLVKDFTWRTAGLRPGYDPAAPSAHYGTTYQFYDANYLGEDPEKLAGKFGATANLVVTMTPRTPLVDGSKGEVVTFTTPLPEIGRSGRSNKARPDVPVAAYRVEAKVVTADGKDHPLKVGTAFRGPWEPSADAKAVQTSDYSNPEPVTLYVHE